MIMHRGAARQSVALRRVNRHHRNRWASETSSPTASSAGPRRWSTKIRCAASAAPPARAAPPPASTTAGLYGGIDNSSWVAELVAELVWPRDLETFQRMRRSDHQVEAILRSIELPIEQGQFAVRPPPDPTAEEQTISDKIEDAYLRRLDGGWEMAVRAALTHLQYGFSVLEETWEPRDGLVLPRRLSYRPQISITGERRDDEGRLLALNQTTDRDDVDLPVEKILIFTTNRLSPDQWRGTSLLRSAYKAWLLKDQAERITAIGHQRWSAGIPIASEAWSTRKESQSTSPSRSGRPSSTRSKPSKRTEQAYLYIPSGFEAGILDRQGRAQTPLDWVRHLDDAMARAILALHLTLGGSTSGSRSLGTSFIDVFLHAVQAWGSKFCDVINEQSIRPLVDFNWPGQQRYPRVAVRNIYATSLERLGYLMQSGVLRPTVALERFVYESLGIDYAPGDIGSQTEAAEEVAEAGADKTQARMLQDIQARLDAMSGGRRSEELRKEQAFRDMMAEREMDTDRMTDMERRVKDLEDA